MKTIQITIQVPDGVNVNVTQGGARSSGGGSKPFVAKPDPEYPEWDPSCPEHGEEWKLIPGGVSKTKVNDDGSPKQFNAFWACPTRGCSILPAWKPKDLEGFVDVTSRGDLPF